MLPSFMTVLPRDVIDAHVFAPLTCADLVHLAMVNVATYNAMRASSLFDYGAARLALVGLHRAVRRYLREWIVALVLHAPLFWGESISVSSAKNDCKRVVSIERRASPPRGVAPWSSAVVWLSKMRTGDLIDSGLEAFDDDDVRDSSHRIDKVCALIDEVLRVDDDAVVLLVVSPSMGVGVIPVKTYKSRIDALDARQRWLLCPYALYLMVIDDDDNNDDDAAWIKVAASIELTDVCTHLAVLWLAAAATSCACCCLDRLETAAAATPPKRAMARSYGRRRASRRTNDVPMRERRRLRCGRRRSTFDFGARRGTRR